MKRGMTGWIMLMVGLIACYLSQAYGVETVQFCNLGAPGDGCIFDLEATEDGLLEVGTQANREGDLWRATIVAVHERPALSNVGTGSATDFTGMVEQELLSGIRYQVLVTYAGPLPGLFPTRVIVRFDGPVIVPEHRPRTVGREAALPGRYNGVWLPQFRTFAIEVSADGSQVTQITADNLVLLAGCSTSSFILDLNPGIPITIRLDGLRGFAVQDLAVPINNNTYTLDIDGVFFNADGFGDTAEQALGGLSFVTNTRRCNAQWRSTMAPDSDNDGWSDTAELRLGSASDCGACAPEHREVPTTPLNGPDTCNDFFDNDGNESTDANDPGCMP